MLKDIDKRKMDDFAVAMVPIEGADAEGKTAWDCYLINLREVPLTNVLVTSRGYGLLDGERRESSTLRYFYTELAAQSAVKLEMIQPELVGLNNEFWVSFFHEGYMYDRRFVFVEGSLDPSLLTQIPVLNTRGVLIT